MKYHEKVGSVFEASADYALAHCISSDAVMGAGIAPKFVRKFPGMKQHVKSLKPKVGTAVAWFDEGELNPTYVFNLITKTLVNHKPTYGQIQLSLVSMRDQMGYLGLKKVAMPLIGCGLDGKEWWAVKNIIKEVFKYTGIEVLVYFYDDWAIKLMEKEDDNN